MFKNRKGFSLVELIVVIAILAVLVAVLAPSLIRYTEDSRAQKDISAMDELVNAVQLALANDKCYDEALEYSVDNNFITYTDSSAEYGTQLTDEEFWAPDGYGKATTITFNPETREDGKTIYRLQNALVNDMTYGNGSVAPNRQMEGAKISDNQCYFSDMELLYNSVRLTVGDTLTPTSTTYRNSSFTVFITFSQKDGVTVAEVNGAFNGTNLHDGCQAASGAGETGAVDAEYSNSNFGGGTSIGMPLYKQDTYIDNLQKDNDFEYYSSAALASKDISNYSIGANADCDRADAVAGIFIDQDSVPTIVIFKDNLETERVQLLTRANIILGGHTLTFVWDGTASPTSSACAIDLKRGGCIDGTIAGSAIIQNTNIAGYGTMCIQASGDVLIDGGTYVNNYSSYGGVCSFTTSKYDEENVALIRNVTFQVNCVYDEALGVNEQNITNILTARKDVPTSLVVRDSKLIGRAEAGVQSLNGVNFFCGDFLLTNVSIDVVADDLSTTNARGVFLNQTASITANNCRIASNQYAVLKNSTNAEFHQFNTKFIGTVSA